MLPLLELLKPLKLSENNYQDAIVTVFKRCCKRFFSFPMNLFSLVVSNLQS